MFSFDVLFFKSQCFQNLEIFYFISESDFNKFACHTVKKKKKNLLELDEKIGIYKL